MTRGKIDGTSKDNLMKIGGIQCFVCCSTCQWKAAGKDNVKQGLSQKMNYISYVETQQQVGKETLKVLERKSEGLGNEMQRV